MEMFCLKHTIVVFMCSLFAIIFIIYLSIHGFIKSSILHVMWMVTLYFMASFKYVEWNMMIYRAFNAFMHIIYYFHIEILSCYNNIVLIQQYVIFLMVIYHEDI